MDKKTLGIVIALGVVLLGIIIAVFLYDAKLNTTIAEVNGVKYDKSDFESYLKVWQYENGDTAVDIDTMFNNYKAYKLYSQYVDNYHVELPSGEQVTAPEEAEITKLATDYNLSESEYMRVKTEIATVDYLFENLQNYWIVSDEEYNSHKEGNEDKFKMYDYRVMQVVVESAPQTSGDVSGDVSGDASGDVSSNVSGDISGDAVVDNSEEARKNRAKAKAVEALAKVKSGDSFEEVAKEYGTSRIVFAGGGYNIVNGTLESVSGLYMDSYVTGNVLEALQTLNVGEYSEIYEEDSYYTFVYLENIREGLDEYDENTYKKSIANEHIQGEALIVDNKITLKSIDLEKLIPAVANIGNTSGDSATDEHDHEDENPISVTISGDASGENASGSTISEGAIVGSGELIIN